MMIKYYKSNEGYLYKSWIKNSITRVYKYYFFKYLSDWYPTLELKFECTDKIYGSHIEITEEQMNIEIDKLKMMKELKK